MNVGDEYQKEKYTRQGDPETLHQGRSAAVAMVDAAVVERMMWHVVADAFFVERRADVKGLMSNYHIIWYGLLDYGYPRRLGAIPRRNRTEAAASRSDLNRIGCR